MHLQAIRAIRLFYDWLLPSNLTLLSYLVKIISRKAGKAEGAILVYEA